MSSAVVSLEVEIKLEVCINCGITFGVPSNFQYHRKKDHRSYFCPNGHSQHWSSKSEEERLKQELEKANQRIEMERNQTAAERRRAEALERRLVSKKGQVTKLKKEIFAGQCIKCSTHFDDLEAHMAESHPKFKKLYGDA